MGSRTVGTTHDTEVSYHIYYGGMNSADKKLRTFWDENAADKFFTEKLQAGLHVEAYREEVKTTRIVKRL